MKWEKWNFQAGEQYLLSEVVGACNERLVKPGAVRRLESKKRMVDELEQCGHTTIVWTPKSERGWGASAFNQNCWHTPDGQPITSHKQAQRKGKTAD